MKARAITVSLLLLLLAAGWFYRFEAITVDRGAAYLLNRWTGDVYLLVPGRIRKLDFHEPVPEEKQ